MNALAPAALASCSISDQLYADIIIIGTSSPTASRIALVVAIPSISGIFQSMIHAKYCFSCLLWRTTCSRACFPVVTPSAFIPKSSSILQHDSRLKESSSATSTSRSINFSLYKSFVSWSFRYIVTVKREPTPNLLSTLISPPIILTMLRLIGIPSPVPWILLTWLSVALAKGSKICFIKSSLIPIPLSSKTNS